MTTDIRRSACRLAQIGLGIASRALLRLRVTLRCRTVSRSGNSSEASSAAKRLAREGRVGHARRGLLAIKHCRGTARSAEPLLPGWKTKFLAREEPTVQGVHVEEGDISAGPLVRQGDGWEAPAVGGDLTGVGDVRVSVGVETWPRRVAHSFDLRARTTDVLHIRRVEEARGSLELFGDSSERSEWNLVGEEHVDRSALGRESNLGLVRDFLGPPDGRPGALTRSVRAIGTSGASETHDDALSDSEPVAARKKGHMFAGPKDMTVSEPLLDLVPVVMIAGGHQQVEASPASPVVDGAQIRVARPKSEVTEVKHSSYAGVTLTNGGKGAGRPPHVAVPVASQCHHGLIENQLFRHASSTARQRRDPDRERRDRLLRQRHSDGGKPRSEIGADGLERVAGEAAADVGEHTVDLRLDGALQLLDAGVVEFHSH